jgi:lysophospholipase L1-like esterase
MSFMNFSGAVRPGYQALRTSTIFVGDSITWGYGLNQNQTIGYNVQNRINTVTGLTQATWGNSASGLDICARNVIVDDTTTSPFQGGAPPNGNTLLTQSGAVVAGLGTYPFSDTTNNSSGSNVSTAYPSTSVCPDAIALSSGASISWNATYPSSTGYIVVGLMGAGTVAVKKGATTIQTLTSGGFFNGTVSVGSPTITLTTAVTGTLVAGNPLYFAGITTSPVTTIVSFTGTSIGSTITMSANSPVNAVGTACLALATNTSTAGGLNVVTVSGATGTDSYTISNSSAGSTSVVVTVLHPTTLLPTTYNEIQINARSSYAISDYSSPSGDTIQKQIMTTATQSATGAPSTASAPIYILSAGTVNLYDNGGAVDRRLTPTQYQTQLNTLATALKNSANLNYGRIILTVPPVPTGSSTLLSPYTLNDYRFKIIELAKTLSCGYIDLSQVKMTSSDYQADGLHPNSTGAAKLAKKYISMLEF